MKVCSRPGCPTLIPAGAYKGRCPQCNRDAGQARGSSTAQGRGYEHQKLRASIQQRIDNGERVTCWQCHAELQGSMWHLDHNDARDGYRGPACIPCNLRLAALASRGTAGDLGLPPDPPSP